MGLYLLLIGRAEVFRTKITLSSQLGKWKSVNKIYATASQEQGMCARTCNMPSLSGLSLSRQKRVGWSHGSPKTPGLTVQSCWSWGTTDMQSKGAHSSQELQIGAHSCALPASRVTAARGKPETMELGLGTLQYQANMIPNAINAAVNN